TGVTTFQLKHEIDTGNILLQEQTHILPDDDFGPLYERLKNLGAELLVSTLGEQTAGKLVPVAQTPTGNEPVAPKLDKALSQIRWENPALTILNLIKGLSPVPGAYTLLEGKKLKIFKAEVRPFEEGATPIPGTWSTDARSVLCVAANDAWLALTD